jgi:hypothetical protein
MRQTNRQSSTVGSGTQPLVLSSQDGLDDPAQLSYSSISIPDAATPYPSGRPADAAPYPSSRSGDAPRSHQPSHRRARHHEDTVEHRKWPSAY